MNLHHLELFYYVAKHGGIMEAVRNIPYGVQQPAVSGQLGQLEHELGQRLFVRRPFALTPGGTELYQFIRPFFDQLPDIEAKLRGSASERLRFAGPTLVLRQHLPTLLAGIRQQYPRLWLELHEASQSQVERALQEQEIDLGITLLEDSVGSGIESAVLMQLTMVLLIPADRPEKTAAEVLSGDLFTETLIGLPETEPVSRRFREYLGKKGLDWPTGIELGSLELIETYVQQRLGIGLSVKMPGETVSPQVRELPLRDLPGVKVGLLWRSPLSPVAQTLLAQLKERARQLSDPGPLATRFKKTSHTDPRSPKTNTKRR